MCAYFSKTRDETSEEMKQAAKEALIGNKFHYEKMKSIASIVQKAVCLVGTLVP